MTPTTPRYPASESTARLNVSKSMKNGLRCSPQKRVQLAQLWMQAFVISIWMISMSAGERMIRTPKYYPLRRRLSLSGSSARNLRTATIRRKAAKSLFDIARRVSGCTMRSRM